MNTRTSVLVALTAAMALVVGLSVRAQRGGRRSRIPEASQTLQSITRLKCAFDAATPNGATVAIDKIDVEDGTAEIAGFFRGGENVNVKLAGATLHFLDIALNGSFTVVTVFAKETHDGRLQAVYSHAAYVLNGPGATAQPEAMQYNGDCEVTR